MAEQRSQSTMGFGSCATLEDGISRVCKGNNVGELDLIPDDEEALLRELEDSWGIMMMRGARIFQGF